MADLKISELSTQSPLGGTELIEVVIGGINKKTTAQDIANLSSTSGDYTRNAVSISAGTLTLNMNSVDKKNFDLTNTQSSAFTIAFSNTTNMVEAVLTLRLTGAVAITMPSTVEMQQYETINGRWNTSTQVLTLTGTTATRFIITFYFDGTVILTQASDPFE